MKRFIYLITAAVILTAAWTITASAETGVKASASISKQTAQVGDVIDIYIALDNYHDVDVANIGGIQVDVSVHPDYFEYVNNSAKIFLKTQTGDFVSSQFNQIKHQYTLMYAYMNSEQLPLSKDNKDILSLQIKIKKELPVSGIEVKSKIAIADTGSPSKPLLQEEQINVIKPPISTSTFPEQTTSDTNKTDPTKTTSESQTGTSSTVSEQTTSDIDRTDPTETSIVLEQSNEASETRSNEITVDIEPEDGLPWDSVVISNTDGKNITVEKSDGGLIVKGDDLSDVNITVSKNGETAKVSIPDGKNGVRIEEKDGQVSVHTDEDGDGSFETEFSTIKYEPVERLSWPLILWIGIPTFFVSISVVIVIMKKRKGD